ncbi:unnamed protein product [Adineta steineri]|uniref:Uncharacterized protein n=1 Tax=Adineta steineri TaxID=433720 RepID=A0A818IYS2_9BILA|nr:unnamed protein product [Adineta steineri]
MATISSPVPVLSSVLTSSHDNNDDYLNQLRNQFSQIQNNFQETLNKIQQHKSYVPIETTTDKVDSNVKNNFFDLLKDVANKNNLPFDEPFYREQFLEKQDSSSSPNVDVVRDKPYIINDQHLSPVNNARRSQFAPVLSSTPVHQTSPTIIIPVDLTMATSTSVAPVLTINSNDLPAVPPSAIVHQRANINRAAGRPPRIPRGESVTRQKKNSSPIKEQQEDIVIEKEIQIKSKRRIKTKDNIIEDNIEIIVEQQNEIIPDIVKQVQATPLRGRKKKVIQDADNNIIPQLEPPPPCPLTIENEIIPKKTRGGRGKKKDEDDVKPKRTTSLRNRKKQDDEIEDISVSVKKSTRNKKLVEPIINNEENQPLTTKIRSTPSRNKKKSPIEVINLSPAEPIIPLSAKKTTTTKSKKRKGNDITIENPIDTIQPPSPKRRGGRNTKSKNSSPVEPIITPPLAEQQPPPPTSTRSSRRGKKDIDIPIEKQEDIVLNKKSRAGRKKKNNEPIITDTSVIVIDVMTTSVTVSAPVPSTKDAKPPRPPVVRKKKSLAMPPLPQMSPSTPPSNQRIQSTSPINDRPLLPIPIPRNGSRRRQQQPRRVASSPRYVEETPLETISSTTRNQKRTQSSIITTPKRVRRDNLVLTTVLGTPGKKRNRCTCEKRRNKICDICASAIDA